MGVHDVEGHLHRVEGEPVLFGDGEHPQMDFRVLVSGETDVTQLSCLPRRQQGGVGAVIGEDAVRVFEAEHLVMLDQVDAVGFQPAQRLFELPGRFLPGAPVDLRHQKRPVAVPVAQGPPHPPLTLPAVVVPGVVEKVDPPVQRRAHDAQGRRFGQIRKTEVPAAKADGRNLLPRAAELPVRHFRVSAAGCHLFASPAQVIRLRRASGRNVFTVAAGAMMSKGGDRRDFRRWTRVRSPCGTRLVR